MGFMDNQLPQTIFELVERFEKNQLFFVQKQGSPLCF